MIAIFFKKHLPMDDSHLGYIKIKKTYKARGVESLGFLQNQFSELNQHVLTFLHPI